MTANDPAGKPRDGFQRWVASLQRPPGAGPRPSEPDVTAALVDESATHVQQIPKELIHRLRERETQGLLGVETERTAVFKPPPELLARAKRMRAPTKPVAPEPEPATLPPPPEAAVPTVRPPPPAKTDSLDDDWAELVEPGLDALKPITPRSAPALGSSRPVAPAFSTNAPRPTASAAPRLATSNAPASSLAQASSLLASGSAAGSRSGPAVVVARTVAVVKGADVGPPPAAPAPPAFDFDEPDDVTRIQGFGGLLGMAAPAPIEAAAPAPVAAAVPVPIEAAGPAPLDEVEAEHTRPRESGVVSYADEPAGELADAAVHDSLAPDAAEPADSGRRWVVIATLFLALVVIALAALARSPALGR